jgi:hypothetical protein
MGSQPARRRGGDGGGAVPAELRQTLPEPIRGENGVMREVGLPPERGNWCVQPGLGRFPPSPRHLGGAFPP